MADGTPTKVKQEVERMQLDISQVTRTQSLFNQNQIQKIWNSTPARFKYTRPAKGGGNWTYIKASYVRKVLDSVFGFNWMLSIDTSLKEAFEVAIITGTCVVKGTVTGRVKTDGEWIALSKTQFGRSDVKFKTEWDDVAKKKVATNKPLDFGNDMKAATSDCLKKCASLFGIGADVYEESEFQEIEITGSDENTDRKKNIKNMIKNAKVSLSQEAEEVV